jgi:uncharacterized protein HemX
MMMDYQDTPQPEEDQAENMNKTTMNSTIQNAMSDLNHMPIFCYREMIEQVPFSIALCFVYLLGVILILGIGLYLFFTKNIPIFQRRQQYQQQQQQQQNSINNNNKDETLDNEDKKTYNKTKIIIPLVSSLTTSRPVVSKSSSSSSSTFVTIENGNMDGEQNSSRKSRDKKVLLGLLPNRPDSTK